MAVEHVENAGVHSGDATMVLPPQKLYIETIRRIREIGREIARALEITGPFNIQFIAKDNAIKVIECNLRASRSFPFVSKVARTNFVELAVAAMMGRPVRNGKTTLDLNYVGVKAPQFSFSRLKGADPVTGVEMASTGEVACLGEDVHEAYLKENGVRNTRLFKVHERRGPNIRDYIAGGRIDLVVSIPNPGKRVEYNSAYRLRRLAVDYSIPILTNLQAAELFVQALAARKPADLAIKHWAEYE